MAEVLLGFAEPKKYVAGEAIAAGAACKLDSAGLAIKTTAGADYVAGVSLTAAAASGDNVTLIHAAWVVPYVATTIGPLMPGPTGTLVAWASTGERVGFARTTGEAYVF